MSLLATCSAACYVAPSLEVSVHHPTGYAVTQTIVKVYFGDDVHCAEIQYGDRTEAELAAITVDEVDVTSGGRIDLSRLGGKSIVARGYDAKHRFVTAGCKDIGEIAGEARVRIDTQPTAVVAIDPGLPERPFSERAILVNMTDTNGKSLEGTVSWQVTGPAGAPEQEPAAGVATADGDARIDVADLGMPGPQALRIRVPWAIAPLPLVTGFDLSGATTIPLPGGSSGGHPSCDLRGHAGELPTLVCLTPADGLPPHRDVVEIAWQTDRYVPRVIPIPTTIDNQFALFVDHDGSADEPVYVLSANALGEGNWYRLGAGGSGASRSFGGPLQGLVYVPRCVDNSVSALVGVQTGASVTDSKQQFFTPAGVPINALPQDGEVVSGGCIADVDKHEHQAVMLATAAGEAVLVLITGASRTQMPIPGPRLIGSGFITVESQGMTEKRFAGTRLQATGTVVFEAVLATTPNGFKLIERTEVEAAAPPTKIIGAKLDRDGDTDLMWDMTALLRRRVFQVSLARQVSGVPLTGMTSGPATTLTANAGLLDFLAGDLDGAHSDEMVVFTANAVTIYSSD